MRNSFMLSLAVIAAMFFTARAFAQDPAPVNGGTAEAKKAAEDPDKTSADPLQDILNELDNSGDSLENVLDNANKKLEQDREQIEMISPEKVLEMLKQVADKMDNAGELILEAQDWDTAKSQEEIIALMKKILEQAEANQNASVDNANKILDFSKESQGGAIKKLEKVIEIIKQNSPGEQGESCSCGKCMECLKRKKEQERQKQEKQNNPKNPKDPAVKPYVAPPSAPPDGKSTYSANEGGWRSGLPAKLREELDQLGIKEIIPDYKDKGEEYYKVLGSEEEK
ncbi:MAG: hypothetical protein HZA48_02070 [Planctomycetes bacterium]|nr:hypothetical protein [Planctomycetota bacterium]